MIMQWANKHGTSRMCWNCEHVEYVGVFEGDSISQLHPTERNVMCRHSSYLAASLPQSDSATVTILPFGFFEDGSKWWCSQWRPSTLPVPTLPPESENQPPIV